MVRYSAIVLAPNAGSPVGALLVSLQNAFERLLLPYEILCIDDASSPEPSAEEQIVLSGCPQLRVLRFDRPRGTSAALSAGIAAARGEVILGIAADVTDAAAHVPHLVSRLARYDFVSLEPRRTFPRAIANRLARWPRLLFSDRRRDGEKLCFAASRPAIAGMTLARGAIRVLPEMVALRGYRVGRMLVADGLPPRGMRMQSTLVPRLLARWHSRRFAPHLALEVRDTIASSVGAVAIRPAAALDRANAPSPAVPLGQQHGEPA